MCCSGLQSMQASVVVLHGLRSMQASVAVLQWALEHAGVSSCAAWAPEHAGLSSCAAQAELFRGTWDLISSTRVFCAARWTLNHWTTRRVLRSSLSDMLFCLKSFREPRTLPNLGPQCQQHVVLSSIADNWVTLSTLKSLFPGQASAPQSSLILEMEWAWGIWTALLHLYTWFLRKLI